MSITHNLRFISIIAPGNIIEITKFLQGYLESEVNLNAEGSCSLTCNDYQNVNHHACRADSLCSSFKPEQRQKVACNGTIRACGAFADSISVCASDIEDGSRYNVVKTNIGKFGNVSATCPNEGKVE